MGCLDSFAVLAGRMVVVVPMHGRQTLDLAEISASCSMVDLLLVDDLDYQIFDLDRFRGQGTHFVDYMSRDYSCYRGYSTAAY